MLLLDVTVCLFAYRPNQSETARRVSSWLTPKLVGRERVAVSEPVLASVIRIATHPRIFETPSTAGDVLQFTDSLVAAPAARVRQVRPPAQAQPARGLLIARRSAVPAAALPPPNRPREDVCRSPR